MIWHLRPRQAVRLFEGGEDELNAKLPKDDWAKGARWESESPESGFATLKRVVGPGGVELFALDGMSTHFEDRLELAGIVFVPRRLAEALFHGDTEKLDRLIGAARGDGTGVVDRMSAREFKPLELKVAQDGKTLYVETL